MAPGFWTVELISVCVLLGTADGTCQLRGADQSGTHFHISTSNLNRMAAANGGAVCKERASYRHGEWRVSFIAERHNMTHTIACQDGPVDLVSGRGGHSKVH